MCRLKGHLEVEHDDIFGPLTNTQDLSVFVLCVGGGLLSQSPQINSYEDPLQRFLDKILPWDLIGASELLIAAVQA